jgi:hypothetical protein
MGNFRTVMRHRKVDRWEVYDTLPALVRAALQEGPQPWDPVGVRRHLRRLSKDMSWPQAVAQTAAWITHAHEAEIAYAIPWNGMKRLPAEMRRPSPHLLAEATMQLSNRQNF